MGTHVALLRGINVGGRHVLPMRDLAAIFERLGCERVRTYIQSGNVVFSAPAALARHVPAEVAGAIERERGFATPVITRTAARLRALADDHPFAGDADDERRLHVGFLAARPTAARVRALDPDRSPGDAFRVTGREILLHLPRGVARTKLTSAYLDATLGTVCTIRTWNTVRALAALT